MIETLLYSWDKNKDYAQRLTTDLKGEQFTHQPAPGMNHPAWVLSHLNAYHPVIESLIRREPFDDPIDHPFGMKSQPQADPSIYPTKQELVDAWVSGHDAVAQALREVGADVFGYVVTLERWKKAMPTIGLALGYLMLLHESVHLGQLSAWRRVQGLPSV